MPVSRHHGRKAGPAGPLRRTVSLGMPRSDRCDAAAGEAALGFSFVETDPFETRRLQSQRDEKAEF